jgi:hypothetical protein
MGTTITIARTQRIGITIPTIITASCLTGVTVAVLCREYVGVENDTLSRGSVGSGNVVKTLTVEVDRELDLEEDGTMKVARVAERSTMLKKRKRNIRMALFYITCPHEKVDHNARLTAENSQTRGASEKSTDCHLRD